LHYIYIPGIKLPVICFPIDWLIQAYCQRNLHRGGFVIDEVCLMPLLSLEVKKITGKYQSVKHYRTVA
jgi:hypothetical protein